MSYLDAFKQATAPVESLYWDKFTLYGFKEIKQPNGSVTNVPNQVLLLDIPCRVYQKARAGTTAVTEGQDPHLSYETKLMCNPKYDIPAGSRIIVTDIYGNTKEYRRADEGFDSYVTHQENTLIRQRDVTETLTDEESDYIESL